MPKRKQSTGQKTVPLPKQPPFADKDQKQPKPVKISKQKHFPTKLAQKLYFNFERKIIKKCTDVTPYLSRTKAVYSPSKPKPKKN